MKVKTVKLTRLNNREFVMQIWREERGKEWESHYINTKPALKKILRTITQSKNLLSVFNVL